MMESTRKHYTLNGTQSNLVNNRGEGVGSYGNVRPVGAATGAVQAVFSRAPVLVEALPVARDARKCAGNDDTCMAWKANGTDFCVGHGRKEPVEVVSQPFGGDDD